MHDRQFVWTWWAGLVRDSFGPGSMFHVARVGSLRIRRVTPTSGEARRVTDGGVRPCRLVCTGVLVPITKLWSVVGGLVKRLSRSENA